MFDLMASDYHALGCTAGMKTIDFQQPGYVDEYTVIPQIILVLRPAE